MYVDYIDRYMSIGLSFRKNEPLRAASSIGLFAGPDIFIPVPEKPSAGCEEPSVRGLEWYNVEAR